MRRILFLIVSLVTACYSCVAQSFDEKKFIHYNVNDGLSNNFITGIVQDSIGYIWISTGRGLNRFDGKNFKQFLHTDKKNSLPDNAIFSMRLISDGQLAIATDDGAQIISTKTLEAKNLIIPTEEALRYWSNACRYVNEDNQGNYGVSTKTGFYIFSHDAKLIKRLDRFTVKDIGTEWMMFGNHVYKMPDGNIMQENQSGFSLFDRQKNQFIETSIHYPAIAPLLGELGKTHDRFLFISTYELLILNEETNSFDIIDIRNGIKISFTACFNLRQELGWPSNVSRIDKNTWAINSKNKGFYLIQIDTAAKAVTCDGTKYFSDHHCTVIFSDKQKRLWIATDEGLFMEGSRQQAIRSFYVEPKKGEANFSVTAIFIIPDKIFAGTNKKEVLVLDKQTKQLIHRVKLDTLSTKDNFIRSFLLVDPDTLWIASPSGLAWLNTRNFSSGNISTGFSDNDEPQFLFDDKKGNVWIGINSINKILYYNKHNRKFDTLGSKKNKLFNVNVINSLAEDDKDNIWIGADAISRWNPFSQKADTLIEYLSTQKNRKKGFSVMNDSRKDIWVMLNEDGFARITGASPVHERPENLLFDFRSGLSPTLVQDKIFMPTENGIGYFDINSLTGIAFTQLDGLPNSPLTTHYFSYDSSDQSIWFACKNILCKIPFISSTSYAGSPQLKIDAISLTNDSTINYPERKIILSHDQNDLKISLSAINFDDPSNMRFAYRFRNDKDSDWTDMGNQQTVLLTNISPGDYKLLTKVYAFDNKWKEQTKEIEIVIKPPFWKTWWFVSLIVMAFITGIFFLYKRRIRKIQEKANIDKQLTEFEMKALHAQMNPHFIFNCLNSIREMILHDENQQASHYLSKFAQLIRITLNQSSKPFVSLQNTIDYLQRYLEMEKVRSNEFKYTIEVSDQLQTSDIMIPPMLIQPFLENAIWHGAIPGKELKLDLRFLRQDGQLVCIIDDNGIGIEASLKNKSEENINHNPVGIANVKERIQVLNEKYNLHSSLTIEDKSNLVLNNGSGTIVKLYFSLN